VPLISGDDVVLLQQVISGFLASGIYALYAVGFTMIFGIMGVLNMAHADIGMVAAMAMVWAVAAGFGPLWGSVFAVILVLLVALVLERAAMRPGRRFKGDAAVEMPLIATIGAGMVMQNTAALIFGNKAVVFPIQVRSFLRWGGFYFEEGLLYSLAITAVLLVALEIMVHRTRFGREVRAVAQNREAARIMGINADRVIVLTVLLTTVLAGIAGWLAGMSYGLVAPLMGIPYAIKGLVAMIVGGVGSLRGAVAGAVLIGVVEALAVTWFGSQVRDLSVFAVLFAVLCVRPGGLVTIPGAR
jgi:branched-chain amino acid transport system permease protein